jgi:hypothetical protein
MDSNSENKTTYHIAICPECDYKELDYKIDAKIDQNHGVFVDVDFDSKMKQASIVAANQHNAATKHSAYSYKLVLISPTEAEKKAQKEELLNQKVELFKTLLSLYR